MATKPTAIGMHIYAGTFTQGIKDAGFKIAGDWEEGPWGAATFEKNFPSVIHPLDGGDWPIRAARGSTQLMFANPPCAPWSVVGAKLGMADPRVAFTDNCVNAALKVEPDIFVWESVCRAMTSGQEKVEEVTEKFHKKGYAVTILLTNGLLHGLPQSRERFHFIAHRVELPLVTPVIKDHTEIMTVRMAIGDLEKNATSMHELPPTIPAHVYEPYDERGMNVITRLNQGEGWEVGYARAEALGLPCKKGRFISWRLWYDGPCGTIADVITLMHPVQNRHLTVREAARLCGLPDSFEFAIHEGGKYWFSGGVCKEDVTQAVMAPVGKFLGGVFKKALKVNKTAVVGSYEVVDWRKIARPYSPRRFMKAKLEREALS